MKTLILTLVLSIGPVMAQDDYQAPVYPGYQMGYQPRDMLDALQYQQQQAQLQELMRLQVERARYMGNTGGALPMRQQQIININHQPSNPYGSGYQGNQGYGY